MHLVGRYTMTRLMGARGLSARMVLARPRAQWPARLTRHSPEDFVVLPSGLAVPAMRGGAGWSAQAQLSAPFLGYPATPATQTTVALSTDYTYNSAGAAISSRLTLPAAKTLNTVYYFATAHAGAPDLLLEIRPDGASKPGTPASATATASPGGTGWKKFTGLSSVIAAGTKTWLVVGDPDGSTNGSVTVLRSTNTFSVDPDRLRHTGFSTTDGFSATVTAANVVGSLVAAFSDSTALGNPITAAASFASSTNRRGWNLSVGLTETLKLLGMVIPGGGVVTSASGVEAYEGATAPGGATAASGTTVVVAPAAAGGVAGYLFDTPAVGYAAPKATAIRIVFTFSGNSVACTQLQIGSGSDATLQSALWGGGSNYVALANGTTDWANDVATAQFGGQIIVEDQVEVLNGSLRTRPRLTLATHGVL